MNPAVAPRHSSRSPSLSLSMNPPSPMEPSSAPVPGTPLSATTTAGAAVEIESPFYLSPKSPKAELGRTRSQSRRTLGNWQLGKTIGQGSMGRVRLGHSLITGEQVAVKIIPRSPPESTHSQSKRTDAGGRPKDENREIRAIREAAIVTLLRHPYICGMRDVIITQGHFYLFFEYVDGGQMLDYIISHGKLREKHARKFARQILSALDYCHRNSIVHRDLKIENILISKSGNIKIIDFGLSNLFSTRSLLTTYCGSLYFAAPELLNAKAYTGPEVDVWSFGIVLYVLVCGKVPFDDQSMAALHAKIKRGFVEYPNWLSTECKSVLSRILVVDPAKRATLAEIAQHPWMSKGGEGTIENYFPARLPLTLPLDDQVIRGMRGFEFGTEDEIREHLTSIILSTPYLKACDQYARLLEVATSSAIAEKIEKRKPFSLEFYKRKSVSSAGSWPENGITSSTSLQFDDPTNAFDPLLSIYYLVREKQERDRQSAEPPARSSGGLSSPKTERALRLPTIPIPEAAHTGDVSYEITTPPGKATFQFPSTRSRTKSRGDEDFSAATHSQSLGETTVGSPRSRLLDEFTGSKSGGLLRRISHKWSKEPMKDTRRESRPPATISTPPQIEIATPSKTLAGRMSREIDRYGVPSPQHLSPVKSAGGLGRSTSVSEADYRKRQAGAVSDDETSTRRRSDWLSSPQTPTSSDAAKSAPSGRTRSMGHARHATISAARRANDRHDRDFWSGPLTGPLTIPEEGKESSHDSNPSTSARDDQSTRPVHLKGLFSVATTSTKPVAKMRADLIRVLDQIGITHEEIKGGFFCVHRPSIALESVQEAVPHAEEYSAGKKEKSRRRLSLGAPIAAAAQFAGFGEKRMRQENESDASAESISDIQGGGAGRAELSGPGSSMVVQFEIYIVKFPWLSLHGIQFKRVGGDVWQYKNACVKILAELNW